MTTRSPFLLAVAVLLCASIACSINAPTPQATPPEAENAQEGAGAVLLVENAQSTTSTPTRYASPTVDKQGTLQMDILNATRTVDAIVHQAVTETKAVSLTQSAYIAQTQTAIPPAQTSAAKAVSTQNAIVSIHATELSISATQTQEYPAVITGAAKAQADAQFAPLRSFADAFAGIVGPLAVLAIAVGLVVVIARPVGTAVQAAYRTAQDTGIIAITESTDDADLVPPGAIEDFAMLMEHGADGGGMGFRAVVDAGIYKRGGYDAVFAWLDKKDQRRKDADLPKFWESDAASRRILSTCDGGGVVWAEKWLQWYHNNAPLLQTEISAENTPPADTGVQNTRVQTSGGVIDPADVRDFGDKLGAAKKIPDEKDEAQ
jgi:hypothetical protein